MIYQDAARPSKEARDAIKALGSGRTIKKRNCSLLKLKLPDLPELGKLEAHATLPLSDMFTLLSPGKKIPTR